VEQVAITMNSLAVQAEVSATTITRLARPVDDPKAASALSFIGTLLHRHSPSSALSSWHPRS